MNNDHTFTFSVNRENHTITIQREFNAGISRVWDAYTQSTLLEQWWAPQPWKARTKHMDFREGGRWHYAMASPEGEEHWALARFDNIRPQKGFTVRDAFADEEGNILEDMPQARWEVTFTEQNQATLVEFHIRFDDRESLEQNLDMGFEEGIRAAMKNLDALLAAPKGSIQK